MGVGGSERYWCLCREEMEDFFFLDNGFVLLCVLVGAVGTIRLVRGRALVVLLWAGCVDVEIFCWFVAVLLCLEGWMRVIGREEGRRWAC